MKLDLNKFEICSSTVMQEQTLRMHIGCARNVMVDLIVSAHFLLSTCFYPKIKQLDDYRTKQRTNTHTHMHLHDQEYRNHKYLNKHLTVSHRYVSLDHKTISHMCTNHLKAD